MDKLRNLKLPQDFLSFCSVFNCSYKYVRVQLYSHAFPFQFGWTSYLNNEDSYLRVCRRQRFLGLICVSRGISQPKHFSFFLVCIIKLWVSLVLREFSVIRVCERLQELPTERSSSTKSIQSLLSSLSLCSA